MKKNFIVLALLLCFTPILGACKQEEPKPEQPSIQLSPYEILVDYLIYETPTTRDHNDIRMFNDFNIMIVYQEDTNDIDFALSNGGLLCAIKGITEDDTYPTIIASYETGSSSYLGTGYINKQAFSDDFQYIYDFRTDASYYVRAAFKDLVETGVDLLLDYVAIMISDYNLGISLYDLGFTNY